jgi:hypothetical protein
MADQKISQLDPAGTLTGSEVYPAVQSAGNVKITLSATKAYCTADLVIGEDVQAYDPDTAKLDVAQDWPARQTFNDGVHIGDLDGSNVAQLVWERNGIHRWSLFRNQTAESGADSGSNLDLYSYDDAGNLNDLIFRVTRSTGVLDFKIAPTLNGASYYVAGGTDVAVADGGTGGSTARAAAANLQLLRVIGHSGVASVLTGSTSETILATIPIAAGELGPNGFVELDEGWSCTNDASTKTVRTRFGASGAGTGGTIFDTATPTSVAAQRRLLAFSNRNSASSQVSLSTGQAGGTGAVSAPTTMSIDSSSATEIVITGQLADSADTLTLERYTVKLYYGA